MKGIVFNLLEEVVTRHQGEDAWDALLESTGLSGVYTALGSYPDEHIYRLAAAAAETLAMAPFEVLRWFGREAMPSLANRYPAYFDAHSSTRPFILSVNQIIHPEVRMIYPGADVPTFGFRDEPEGTLIMTYRSPRRLCALAHGFIEGAAVHFGETLGVDHLTCMHRGDVECRCRITFHGKRRG
ncbi:heme NO-binding protein [Pseudomonas sp. BN415]|uniref:heme NO-binding domain-containing protein n=1 Tax=Pseudomonas sp. BN415 TaxID=2567889 RepID=UPI0024563D25|nr:heme NO-binding domain-containing protein [Pseudomonas sp. BN415]MDH4584245.1 heme NO-binding protein [Pseudomonas sp. BN415]